MSTQNGAIVERDQEGYGGEMIASGHTVQQVRTSYATAVSVQKPRRLAEVQRRVLEEAALAGTDFYYGWGAGKDRIEGPSVKLAMALARCWGNGVVETLPVQDLPDAWIFTAAFIDLETGFTITRQFRQSKEWKVFGRHDDERKADIRFQIGQSKAARNVILNALPSSIVDAAMEMAKEGVIVKIEAYVKEKGLPAAVDAIIGGLTRCGVKESAILARVSKAKREGIDVHDIAILKGDLRAIQKGEERADVLFPAAPNATTEDLAEKLKERIKATKEVLSTEPAKEEKAAAPERARRSQLSSLDAHAVRLKLSEAAITDMLLPYGVNKFAELSSDAAAKVEAEMAAIPTQGQGETP